MNARRRRRRNQSPVWPLMLIGIALVSIGFFILQLGSEPAESLWLQRMAFIPAAVMEVLIQPWSQWFQAEALRLFWALFLHLEWLHLLGNLAYLWVFGITVERAVGHWRFL
ncbi:MAG: rhomboid family intramembrane serine protease, partial [Pseudomonadota bacterium]